MLLMFGADGCVMRPGERFPRRLALPKVALTAMMKAGVPDRDTVACRRGKEHGADPASGGGTTEPGTGIRNEEAGEVSQLPDRRKQVPAGDDSMDEHHRSGCSWYLPRAVHRPRNTPS